MYDEHRFREAFGLPAGELGNPTEVRAVVVEHDHRRLQRNGLSYEVTYMRFDPGVLQWSGATHALVAIEMRNREPQLYPCERVRLKVHRARNGVWEEPDQVTLLATEVVIEDALEVHFLARVYGLGHDGVSLKTATLQLHSRRRPPNAIGLGQQALVSAFIDPHERGSKIRFPVVRPIADVPELANADDVTLAAVEQLSASGWEGPLQSLLDMVALATTAFD